MQRLIETRTDVCPDCRDRIEAEAQREAEARRKVVGPPPREPRNPFPVVFAERNGKRVQVEGVTQ
jgi:hypothetical protein